MTFSTISQYRETLHKKFNVCVAENAFKQPAVWKGPYEYSFEEPDRLAAFAPENGMARRGHTLIWHQAVPHWLRDGDYPARAARDMLQAYIRTFVGRSRGRIDQ